MRRAKRERLAVLALVLCLGALGAVALATSGDSHSGAAESTQGRVCLSAEVWSADDAERPCARIVKVWEDGSTRVVVTQADGEPLFTSTTGSRW